MSNSDSTSLDHSIIYQKSIDVFKLSRSVASYITDDKDVISMYRSGMKSDNYADNLVMNAFRLVQKVVETETQESPTKKLKYAKSLQFFIEVIYQDCLKLERTKIRGKDFVRLLRKELKSLQKIHRLYVSSLL